MKIGIADNCALKFLQDVKDTWEKDGHEVRYEIGASEHIAQWADVYWIDWWDNNIHYLYNWYKEHPEAKKPKFIVRAIDWDIWVRGIRSQDMVNFVDHFVCIAPHMEKWLRNEKDDTTGNLIDWGNKLTLIRPGVNIDRFTLKKSNTDGFQIGMVLGDMWWYKNHMGGLDIFSTIAKRDPRFHLHIRGQHEPGQYNPVMFEHYLESRNLKDRVTLYAHAPNMNEWYEKIDILIHPGMKETFCYAAGEAMAKGIPCVINEFYGSRDIWPNSLLYKTHRQAFQKIIGMTTPDFKVNRDHIRGYIDRVYNMKRMVEDINKLIDTFNYE